MFSFEDFEGSAFLGWTMDSGVTISAVKGGTVGRFIEQPLRRGYYTDLENGIIEYSVKLPQTNAFHTISAFRPCIRRKRVWFEKFRNGRKY